MNSRSRRVFNLFATAFLLWPALAYAESHSWKHFISRSGFELRFPSDWKDGDRGTVRFNARLGSADAKSPGPVPLSSGQARITTFELDSVAEIDRMVAQIKRDDSDVRERTLTNRSADKHTCETIREISSLFEFGPGSHEQNIPPSYERNVHLFCRIGTRAFVTYLWYSPEDRVGKRYANAALAIMGSLKIAKP